jgi:hypothetical protein
MFQPSLPAWQRVFQEEIQSWFDLKLVAKPRVVSLDLTNGVTDQPGHLPPQPQSTQSFYAVSDAYTVSDSDTVSDLYLDSHSDSSADSHQIDEYI